MIKKLICIILAISIFTALNPSLSLGGIEDLPTIKLKNAKLRGTAVSPLFKPIAIVEHTDTDQNCWYKVGDILCGGRIIDIQRGAVVLEMNGRRYLFGLPSGAVEGTYGGLALSNKEKDVLGEKIGDNVWNVELDDAIDVLTNVSKIMKEARIRPYFAIGKAAGVRVDRIKDGSVITQMGLKDGDIIKGVNGFGLMNPTKVFQAYRKYRNDKLIKVQLIRDEEPITLTYNIVR